MSPRIWLPALLALGACAHHEDVSTATLAIEPATVDLTLVNGVAVHQSYQAFLVFTDGTRREVTGDSLFSVDSAFGAFAGNDLAVGIGGHAQVFGTYQDKTGAAELTARVRTVRVDPSLPPGTPDVFNGADDPALAPTVVYPPAGAVMPRNVGDFEVHWTDGHAQDVFEVSLHTEYTDVKLYVKGGNGLAATGPHPSWVAFQAAEWTTGASAAAAVDVKVRGAVSATGKVGGGAAQSVVLSREDMLGGLYYWAAASAAPDAVTGIFRHDMARPGEAAEEFLTTKQTSGRCVACHVLSRDGTKMAITYDGGGKPATMVDVATRSVANTVTAWNFATLTPDNQQLLSVEAGVLTVRDASTQGVIATMTAATPVSHPDLSADGRHLVYVSNPTNSHDWDFSNGAVITRTYDPATHTFGPEVTLHADGKSNFYPSWSPDGQWVVFNKAATGASTYDDAAATTWVIKADGSAPAIHLAAADQTTGLTNSWPRWAPFPQTLGTTGEPLYWITLASKRDFGVRLRNTGLCQRPAQCTPAKSSQIWMTPFLPARASAGQDPSAPAFRLPFQNLTSSNHIAQWTERVVVFQ